MKWFNKKLGGRIHGLNLLNGANLNDSGLRLAIRKITRDQPMRYTNKLKKCLKNTLEVLK